MHLDMPDTTTAAPSAAGYIEIESGMWLEAGEIDPCRLGRIALLEPRALRDGRVQVSAIGRAFARATGWHARVRWMDAHVRLDGWVVVACDFTELAGPIPVWANDPDGCWWAAALPASPPVDDR